MDVTLESRVPAFDVPRRLRSWLMASILVHGILLVLWPGPDLLAPAGGAVLKVALDERKRSPSKALGEHTGPTRLSGTTQAAEGPDPMREDSTVAHEESVTKPTWDHASALDETSPTREDRAGGARPESRTKKPVKSQPTALAVSRPAASRQAESSSSSRPVSRLRHSLTPTESAPVIPSGPAVSLTGQAKATRDSSSQASTISSMAAADQASVDLSTTARTIGMQLQDAMRPHFYYPMLARRRGWQGVVRVGMRVAAGGRLENIRVVDSSGYKILDRAAVRVLSKVKALPHASAWLSGISLDLVLPVEYRLSDG